jgi:tetratricopeptide (TPR) repeat protein
MKISILTVALFVSGISSYSLAQDVTVTATVTTPDDTISQQYIATRDVCGNSLSKHDAEGAVEACKKLSDEADKYDPKTHPISRREAYVYYATALVQAQRYKEAVMAGDKAVAVLHMGYDDASGSSAVYFVRGQAKADAGNLAGGDQDLQMAEKILRDRLLSESDKFQIRNFSFTLKYELMFHAQVLKALGNNEGASKMLEEASKLEPTTTAQP